ncbi:MAG: hypothetical protein ACRD6X_09355 [Pyrinomonadaceae bacterium]
MGKNFWIAGAAAFLISLFAGFIGHGLLLQADYAQVPNLMRTAEDAAGYLPFMLVSHLIKGFAFAWVYKKGISDAPWLSQGIRFGIAMTFLIAIPLYLVYYAVQPTPGRLVVNQIVVDAITMILMALAVAFIFKPKSAAS